MRIHPIVPVLACVVGIAACSDNEPPPPAPSSVPAPTAPVKPTTREERSREPMNGATSTVAPGVAPGPVNDPPVLRGDQAGAAGAAKVSTPPAPEPAPAVAPTTATEGGLLPPRTSSEKAEALTHAADDSGRNMREDGSQPTPLDQGESEADRTVTQGIRARVVEREDLSASAKNVKIITRNGVVTLRGPVADGRERDAIIAIANAQRGVTQIDNRLEPLQQ